jgi:hypothetical protein
MVPTQICPPAANPRSMRALPPLVLALGLVGVVDVARADVPVSLGTAGALERAGLAQDGRKNPTAASFGAPVTDDRRLFTLRWRLPWIAMAGAAGPSPFGSGFVNTGLGLGGMSFAAEPMEALSALVPQGQIGEANKLGRVQFGALSYSLGHGTVVDRFTNAPDGQARRFGLLGELNLAGLELHGAVGDVMDAPAFVTARVAGRPLIWFLAPDATFQPNELDLDPRTELLGIWQIAVAAAADFSAPGTDNVAGNVVVTTLENEAAILDNQLVKLIIFVDVNGLWSTDRGATVQGTGVHPGVTAMWDFAGVRVDVDAEANVGSDGYVPRYFDRLYFLERTRTLGADKPKLLLERPASWGYRARADVGLWEMATLFAELRDQRGLTPTTATLPSNMTLSAGGSVWLGVAGAAVTATQIGLGDNALFGPGFVVTAEGRAGILFNTLHLVGRAWQAHIAAGDDPGEFVVERGLTAGVEVNFDLL